MKIINLNMKNLFAFALLMISTLLMAQKDSLDIKIGQMLLVGVAEQQLDSSSVILQEIRKGKFLRQP